MDTLTHGNEGQPEGNTGLPGVVRLSQDAEEAYKQRGIVRIELKDSSGDKAAFCDALNEARNADTKNGWCVTPKTEEQLNGAKAVITSADGRAGLAVDEAGDITAVFKNRNGGPSGALNSLIPAALEAGGNKLDCYGERLVSLYSKFGFIPVARVEFNSKHANEGWTPEKGTPYIYFMMHNGDSAAEVIRNTENYKQYTMEELEKLPTYGKDGYEEAWKYRDSLMESQNADTAEAEMPEGAKISQTWANSIDTRDEMTGVPMESRKPLWYMPITEAESLLEATSRLEGDTRAEAEKLMAAEAWTGVQTDEAWLLYDRIAEQCRASGDWSALEAWKAVIQSHGTITGQALQANAKWSRGAKGIVDRAIDTLSEAKGLSKDAKNAVISEVSDYADRFENALAGEDKETRRSSLETLVKELSERRRTGTFFKNSLDKALAKRSAAWLEAAATAQINMLAVDAANRGKQNLARKAARPTGTQTSVKAHELQIPTSLFSRSGEDFFAKPIGKARGRAYNKAISREESG